MYLGNSKRTNNHTRIRNGREEIVTTKQKVYILQCDSCGGTFERSSKQMKPGRASNEYTHVCNGCNSKVFAQIVSARIRKVNGYDASSSINISDMYLRKRKLRSRPY